MLGYERSIGSGMITRHRKIAGGRVAGGLVKSNKLWLGESNRVRLGGSRAELGRVADLR